MNVKILKLVNGEDVIADITKENEKEIVMVGPAKLMTFPSEDSMAMAILPWCPYTDKETFTISRDHVIISIFPVSEGLCSEYVKFNDKFDSGIVTPPTDIYRGMGE